MATPTIIATPGATNANAFGTLAESETYFDAQYHPDDPWSGFTDAQKTVAIIMATRWMTSLIEWTGYWASTTQALPWPRNGMWHRNDFVYVDSTTVPDEVKWCCFETARLFLVSDRTNELEQSVNNLALLKVGSIRMDFRNAAGKGTDQPLAPIVPEMAINLLVPSWVESVTGIDTGVRDLERS